MTQELEHIHFLRLSDKQQRQQETNQAWHTLQYWAKRGRIAIATIAPFLCVKKKHTKQPMLLFHQQLICKLTDNNSCKSNGPHQSKMERQGLSSNKISNGKMNYSQSPKAPKSPHPHAHNYFAPLLDEEETEETCNKDITPPHPTGKPQ